MIVQEGVKKFKEDNFEILVVDTRCVCLSLCLFFHFSHSACIHFFPHSGDWNIEALSSDVEKLSEAIVSSVVIHPKIHDKENICNNR